MNKFFESNPGLKSRFNNFIEFEDYNAIELEKILETMCKNNDYILSDTAKNNIKIYFDEQISNKTENFANGRMVRNIYDDLVMNHARRIITTTDISRDTLSLITDEDFIIPNKVNDNNDN